MFAIIWFHPAYSGVIRDDVPISDYQAVANDPLYASSGKITFGSNSDWAGGVLVGNNWVLTAAHIVNSNYLNNTPSNVQFTVGGNTYSGIAIFVNPGYQSSTPQNGNDIALVQLSSPVTNVAPAALYTGNSALGEVGTYVGWGKTGDGLAGMNPSSGATHLGGTNVIDVTGNLVNPSWSSNILLSDFDSPTNSSLNLWGSATPTPLEYLPCDKDSGSGLFVTENGQTYLAGIVDFALFNNNNINFQYGSAIGSTGVAGQVSWIQTVTGVPEVPSGLMAGMGGLVLSMLCLKWRQKGITV